LGEKLVGEKNRNREATTTGRNRLQENNGLTDMSEADSNDRELETETQPQNQNQEWEKGGGDDITTRKGEKVTSSNRNIMF